MVETQFRLQLLVYYHHEQKERELQKEDKNAQRDEKWMKLSCNEYNFDYNVQLKRVHKLIWTDYLGGLFFISEKEMAKLVCSWTKD